MDKTTKRNAPKSGAFIMAEEQWFSRSVIPHRYRRLDPIPDKDNDEVRAFEAFRLHSAIVRS